MSRSIEIDVLKAQEDAVLVKSKELPVEPIRVHGYDFNNGIDFSAMLQSYAQSGFQATYLSKAITEVSRMLSAAEEPVSEEYGCNFYERPFRRQKHGCTIFLGYTSNLISAGLRETIRFLAEHNLIDCLVSSAGGIEEDFIKCLGSAYIGSFSLDGVDLRNRGINRIGNLLMPNDNYCKFEDWLMPILDVMLEEQKQQVVNWTPSRMIHRLGKEINNVDSVYYWAYKNNIPVFCPGLTDGSLGDMLYFHSYRNPGLIIDIVEDIRLINDYAVQSQKTGVIILGGGLMKHHILNANLMRNGADFAVFVNTGQEFDGSDSGASPNEAISWGKIQIGAQPVKVCCDATIAFPFIVAETFARKVHKTIPN